ncbi:hypothetical protein [Pontibacillus salipaludis]|uniref:DUF1056 family protein n=1 Tax=Pontibacillus salipaludis TaxID=1697394 RepID=A0ABQ1QBK3_9BACI|nr:hypothetical protein [Pontibacillus salipaludis]GGD21567.1 hypothetical protein GCM10011389_31550 [Pontibacillus salipaludis]
MLKKLIYFYLFMTNLVFVLSVVDIVSGRIAAGILVTFTFSLVIFIEIASRKGRLKDIE